MLTICSYTLLITNITKLKIVCAKQEELIDKNLKHIYVSTILVDMLKRAKHMFRSHNELFLSWQNIYDYDRKIFYLDNKACNVNAVDNDRR